MSLLTTLGLKRRKARSAGLATVIGNAGPAQASPPNGPFADLGKGTEADKAAYRLARDKLKHRLDHARRVRADASEPLSADLAKRFDSTLGGIDTLEAQSLWLLAKGAMVRLEAVVAEVDKAWSDRDAFRTALDAAEADIEAAQKPLRDGLPLPEPQSTNLSRSTARVEKARSERDWVAAGKGLPSLVAAAKAANTALASGKKFYDTLAAMKADHDAARTMADRVEGNRGRMGPLGLIAENFTQAEDVMKQHVGKGKWTDAIAAAGAMKDWGAKLVKAAADFGTAAAPFLDEFDKLRPKISNADRIDNAAPAALKAKEGKAFRTRLTAVNDARDAGDFAKAVTALQALGTAIADLEKADQALEVVQAQLDVEIGSITNDHDVAEVLAEAPPPAMKKLAADFVAADKVVRDAYAKKEWAAGKAAMPALRTTMTALLQARTSANKGAGTQQVDALRKRLDTLKPRTDKASEAPVPAHVDELQKLPLEHKAKVETLLTASNVVDAEVQLNLLGTALDAMEKAKAAHAAYLRKFEAARDGNVKKARALALQPDALAAVRTKSLDDAQAGIVALADRGDIEPAEKATLAWAKSATAWASAKSAYESLHGDNPNVATLSALGAKAGGTDVLDALVADLGAKPPQKVMTVALKARYGIDVKRFADRNEDVTDLAGLDANKPDAPDQSLRRVYEMLGKVPTGNTKGKVTDLVVFDESGGKSLGGYTEDGKVYLYSGRPQGSATHRLGIPGQVVPVGEDVDEACRPADPTPPATFDFMLLHEAAHTLDNSMSFMKSRLGNASYGNWKKHSPGEIAAKVATHFNYSEAYVVATLGDPSSKPPDTPAPLPKGGDAVAWDKAREDVVKWCQSVREYCDLWYQAGASKQVMIGDRVYQEAYLDGKRWYSYPYAERSKGITGYQFRAPGEWFAELYAAYFSGKLRAKHPAVAWLKDFGQPKL